jgi:cytochrome oxidase Cu insertion factor (SCO1/SenC/PrrC family)
VRRVAFAAAGAFWASAVAFAGVDPGAAVAPRMEFTPPQPGSYTLQKIQRIAGASLLDPSGRLTPLASVTTGKITLLTFFYTYCADPLGCPFAYRTLTAVRDSVLQSAGLAQQVRFVSISLDPTTDTPEAIGRYHDMVTRGSAMEWDVLTARSVRELLPVLSDFGQDISVEQAADGTPRRTVHHMLKMFLIDRAGVVREIYTLAYLQPAVIVNDIRTLFLEQRTPASQSLRPVTAGSPAPGRAGSRGAQPL